jgi:hypothetical protein
MIYFDRIGNILSVLQFGGSGFFSTNWLTRIEWHRLPSDQPEPATMFWLGL